MTTERTTKYATTVDDLAGAWRFVMAHVDDVGPNLSIHVTPMWVYGDNDDGTRKFEVAVSGMTEHHDVAAEVC